MSDDDNYDVTVTMEISKNGRHVDQKKVDFGKLREAQVKGLADLFSMLSANMEYLKSLTPQFEKIDKSKPTYLQ
jgi:Zn-finger domain-containing protein